MKRGTPILTLVDAPPDEFVQAWAGLYGNAANNDKYGANILTNLEQAHDVQVFEDYVSACQHLDVC